MPDDEHRVLDVVHRDLFLHPLEPERPVMENDLGVALIEQPGRNFTSSSTSSSNLVFFICDLLSGFDRSPTRYL